MKKIFTLLVFTVISLSVFAATNPTAGVSSISVTKAMTGLQISYTLPAGVSGSVLILSTGSISNPSCSGYSSLTTSNSDYNAAPATFGTGDKVVYAGTSSSVLVGVTNLTAGTVYYVKVLTYNYSSGLYYYQCTTSPYNNYYYSTTTTISTQPTSYPSPLTVSTIKPASAKLSFTPVSASGSMVVAKTAATGIIHPDDGTAYSASSAFGSAYTTGTDNYVVYRGTGGSVTMTGLTGNTNYTASVYSYNGSGGSENYNGSSAADVSFTTQADAPATEASSVIANNTDGTSTFLKWTNGDGTNRVVTITPGTVNTCLDFNGSSNYVDVAGESNFDFTTSFTVEAWIRVTNFDIAYQPVITKGDDSWRIQRDNVSNQIQFGVQTSVSNYYISSTSGVNDNVWHHIAGVYTGSQILLYVDGVLENSQSASGTVVNNAYNVNIGRNAQYPARLWDGKIDEVRIWSTAQSAATIAANKNKSVAVNSSGLKAYYKFDDGAVAGGSTIAANSCTNTSGVNGTLVSFANTDQASGYATGWAYSGAKVNTPVDFTSYTASNTYGAGSIVGTNNYCVYNGNGYAMLVTGLSPNTTYTATVYEYNGGVGTYNNSQNYRVNQYGFLTFTTIAAEPTTSASTLTFSNTTSNSTDVSWTNGNGGKRVLAAKATRLPTALSFDGTDDYVAIANIAALNNSYYITTEAWINADTWKATAQDGTIASTRNTSSGGWTLSCGDNGKLKFFYANSGGTAYTVESESIMKTGRWHHVAATFDGNYVKLYIDGIEVKNTYLGGSIGAPSAGNLYIGANPAFTGRNFDGQIDEVRVWNSTQSASSIASYKNKTIPPNDGNALYSLIGYWKLNDGYAASTTALNSSSTPGLTGTLMNFSSTAAASGFTSASGWVYQGSGVNAPVDGNNYNPYTTFGVTSTGTYFGDTYYVLYDGTATSTSVSNLMPNTIYHFELFESNDNGTASNRNYFASSLATKELITTALPSPTITSFSPTSGILGTTVTITGTNFSSTTYSNIVRFGGVRANVLTATATQLTVQVPAGASLAPITVTTNYMTAYSRLNFDVKQNCAGAIDAGAFSIASTLATYNASYPTTGFGLFDMDTDGKPDVVASNYGASASTMSLIKNITSNGVISTNAALNYAATKGNQTIVYGDIDGDGKLDIINSNRDAGTISVYINTTYSTPSASGRVDFVVGATPYSIATSDMDGDGRVDIIVGTSSANVYVLRNISTLLSPAFEQPVALTFSGASDLRNIAVGDFNNDNKPEIIAGCYNATTLGMLINASTSGSLSFTSTTVARSASINSIAVADLNYDDKLDVVVAYSNNTVETSKNNYTGGTITFSSFSAISGSFATLANTPSSIALSDLDGDNKVDVVLGYAAGTSVSVYKNSTSSSGGNIALSTKVDYTISSGNPVYVAANDLNADGKPEIAVAANNASIYVFNNNINQTASEPTAQASSISFSNVSTTGMTVSFTAGNGSNRLVLISENAAVTQLPIDAIGYTANTVYGSGTDLGNGNYVVYNGTSNSVAVTNLKSSTTYYYSVFEFNGSSCDFNYLTSALVSGSKITNNATPTLSAITNPAAICQNSSQQTVNLSGIGTGAANETQSLTITASSSNTSVIPNPTVTYTSPNATGTLKYTPVSGQSGTSIITVTVNDNQSNNNTIVQTFTVTVNAPPTTSNAGTNQDICFTTYNLLGNTPTSGTGAWSVVSTNNGLIALSSASNPNATIGNYNINDSTRLAWTISNAGCTPSVSYVNIKRVSCPLTAGFTSDKTTTCIGTTITYMDASVSGGTTIQNYAWTFSGTGVSPTSATGPGPHVVTYTSIGSKNVQLTITDNTAANASINNTVTIMNKPTNPASPVSGPSPVCAGSQGISYSVTELNTLYREATYYVWTLPSGATISAGDSTAFVDLNFANNASTGIITVKGGNQCGESNATPNKTISIDPKPGVTGTITGTAVVCPGQNSVAYSIPAVSAANGYTWNLPFGASILSGANSNSIIVNFAANAQSGPINVLPGGDCGDGTLSADFDVTVNQLPSVPSNIISSIGSSICEGSTSVSFDVTAGANTNDLIWSVPTGAVLTFNDSSNQILVNFPVGAQSGNVSVHGKNSCGNGPALTYAVTVNPLPAAASAITGTPTVCQSQPSVSYYVAPIANATGYVWDLPAGASIVNGANTNSIIVDYDANAVSGTVSVYGTNACGNGTVSSGYNVTVNPLPATPSSLSGNATVCAGASGQAYSVAALSNTTSYVWQTPQGTIVNGANDQETISLDFSNDAQSGYIIVHGVNLTCGAGLDDTLMVTVNPLPAPIGTITGNGNITICPVATGVAYSVAPVANATSYVWLLPAGASIASGAGTENITVDFSAASVTDSVSVYAQNSCGIRDTSITPIEVAGIPTQQICVVTVDHALNKNVVVFEKSQLFNPQAYKIYRESTAANVYTLEATIPGDSLSEYIDMTSQPDARSYRYKMTLVDSCGNESDSGYVHKTIHLNVSLGVPATNVNLLFEAYEGFDYGTYMIHRRESQSVDVVIDSIPSTLLTYTDVNAPAGADSLYYYVEMISPSSCNSDYKVMAGRNYNSGKSNTAGLRYADPNAIREGNNIFNVSVYPNPNNGQFTLEILNTYANQETTVSIFDMQGRLLFEEQNIIISKGSNLKQFDLSSYAKGAYHIQVRNSKGVINKKVVID